MITTHSLSLLVCRSHQYPWNQSFHPATASLFTPPAAPCLLPKCPVTHRAITPRKYIWNNSPIRPLSFRSISITSRGVGWHQSFQSNLWHYVFITLINISRHMVWIKSHSQHPLDYIRRCRYWILKKRCPVKPDHLFSPSVHDYWKVSYIKVWLMLASVTGLINLGQIERTSCNLTQH